MFNPSSFRYVVVRRQLDFGFSREIITMAIPRGGAEECVGVGLSKEEAVRNMVRHVRAKYGHAMPPKPEGFEGQSDGQGTIYEDLNDNE